MLRGRPSVVVRLIGALLLMLASVPFASAVNATETESISAKALTSHDCNDSEWHFVITSVADEASAPDTISVTWAAGGSASVSLTKFTGGTAHYSTSANLSSTVTAASATIYKGWSGQFNLSHGPCTSDDDDTAGGGNDNGSEVVTVTAPTVVESCGQGGAVVTITAAAHVTFRLNGEIVAAGQHLVDADASGKYKAVVKADAEAGFSIDGKTRWDLSGTLECQAGGGGSTTSTISAKALTDYDCNDSEWHFVINQLSSDAQAPASITVTFTGGVTLVVQLEKVTGGTAHYRTTQHLGLAVTGATANITGDWDGQFNLSHGPCDTTGEQPGQVTATTPTVVENCEANNVTVTIPSTAHVIYKLNGTEVAAGNHVVAADSNGAYVVTVTAMAHAGYTLIGTAQWNLSGTLDCAVGNTEVTAGTPTVVEVCAQNGALITIPATANVTYKLNGNVVAAGQHLVAANPGGNYSAMVTATANTGFVLKGTAQWNLSGKLDCAGNETLVVAETPTVTVDCTAGGVVVTIPSTPHVSYLLNGSPVAAGAHAVAAGAGGSYSVTVTAQAAAGYTLTGTSTFTSTGTLSCGSATPTVPVVVPGTSVAAGGTSTGGAGTPTAVLGSKQGQSGSGSNAVGGVLAATGQTVPLPVLIGLGMMLLLGGLALMSSPRRVLAGLTATPQGKHHRG